MLSCSWRGADAVHGGALKIARTPRFDNWKSFSLNAGEKEEQKALEPYSMSEARTER